MGRRIESPFTEWPGHIEFPEPLLGRHYKAWARAVELKRGNEVEDIPLFAQYRGALVLVETWSVDGIAPADLRDEGCDAVPTRFMSWLRDRTMEYVAEQLSPKASPAPSGITSPMASPPPSP